MNCHDFQEIARDFVRQQWLSPADAVNAARHVEHCAGCRAVAERERRLTMALGELAEGDRAEAPPEVEQRAMAAFRQRRARAGAWRRVWLPAAAAAAVLLAVLFLWARWKRGPGELAVAGTAERVTEFIPLHYGMALQSAQAVQVMRIQLPRSEMRRFGLPVTPEPDAGFVKADVLIGEDGFAKAIRFVY